jgi:outer membrane protein assembly factor BamB
MKSKLFTITLGIVLVFSLMNAQTWAHKVQLPDPSQEPVVQKDPAKQIPQPDTVSPVKTDSGPDWPLFRGNSESTGVARSKLPEKLEVLWEFPVKKGAFSSTAAIVDDGTSKLAVIGDLDGRLYALDLSTGKPKWEYKNSIGFIASVGAKNGKYYLGDIEGNFFCIDGEGKEVWKFMAQASIDSSANFFGENVLFTSQDSNFYCLRADNGELVWQVSAGDQLRSTPTIAQDRAFVAGCDGLLHIIDLKAGAEVGSVEIQSPTGCTPAVLGDAIFFGTEQSGFYAIDWRQAKSRWQFNDEQNAISVRSNAAVRDGHIIFGSSNRRVQSLDPATGKVNWSTTLKANIESSPVIVDERLFIGGNDGRLIEMRWKDGSIIAEHEVFRGGFSGSPAVGFGCLVIATDRGVVYCLGSR